MPVLSSTPTSRRMYLSQTELAQFADITITDTTETDDRISQAEEIVDAYCGFSDKFYEEELVGKMAAVTSNSIFLMETLHVNVFEKDCFKWCQVEIVGGTGAGQRRTISTSSKEGYIELTSAFTTTPDTTSFYKITQLGKFPRTRDVTYYSQVAPYVYLKSIPEEVKRATAAQVEYIIAMGDSFFSGDKIDKTSESIGDYSYSNGNNLSRSTNLQKLIAPKARILLKSVVNRLGSL